MTVRVNLLSPGLAGATTPELRELCQLAEDGGIDGWGWATMSATTMVREDTAPVTVSRLAEAPEPRGCSAAQIGGVTRPRQAGR